LLRNICDKPPTKPTLTTRTERNAYNDFRDTINAISVFMEGADINQLTNTVIETVGGQLESMVSETADKIEEMVSNGIHEELNSFAVEMGQRYVKHREQLEGIIARGVERVTQMTNGGEPEQSGDQRDRISYAEAVVQQLTQPIHEPVIHRNRVAGRQLMVKKVAGLVGEELAALTEQELLTKAKLALDLMGIAATDRPEGLSFVGVRKLAGGDIVLQLDSDSSAEWIRKPDVLKSFNSNFCGTVPAELRTFRVVLEMVPVAAEMTTSDVLRQVEAINGLPPQSLQSANWIKHPSRRKHNQQYAHAMVKCTSVRVANRIMRDKVSIWGRLVEGRKPEIEIRRCIKCQQRKWHSAAECKSEHDICGRCGDHHKTTECQVQDRTDFRCAVCKEQGHGAIDMECPAYQKQLDTLRKRMPETRYRYYPTNEPWTWERDDDNSPMTSAGPLETVGEVVANRYSRWPVPLQIQSQAQRHQMGHTEQRPSHAPTRQNGPQRRQTTIDGFLTARELHHQQQAAHPPNVPTGPRAMQQSPLQDGPSHNT
jgi:hypothetical protein